MNNVFSSTSKKIDTDNGKIQGIQENILTWSEDNLRDFPWRKNMTPYRVLVAELLLRRTTAKAVERIYDEFLAKYPTIRELAQSDRGEIMTLLKNIGYHNDRSKIIIGIAKEIERKHGGEIPKSRSDLLSIKHIGHYTAGAILSLGYGETATMLDSNVKRILKRLFKDSLGETNGEKEMLSILGYIAPVENHQLFNLGLIDLGATICTYREMSHQRCPVRTFCDYYKNSISRID